jgi:predicted DNA binding CopG/RHH family protein
MPGTKKKPIPRFPSEDGVREFWAGHDSTEFIDWQSAQRRKFPNLKPTLRTISVRLPVSMIEDLKVLANKKDVPYQSLLKVFLAERLEKERRRA